MALFIPAEVQAAETSMDLPHRLRTIADMSRESPMVTIPAGEFLMGTARSNAVSLGLDGPYDGTEQPQRRIWVNTYLIDRDEVSLGEYLRWLSEKQRALPDALYKLIHHVVAAHALTDETLARWPALYVTWGDASDFCRAQVKRLPTEAEWEKAARGDGGRVFPWGQTPPTPGLAMFGQYHVHEIPIVAAVDHGGEGQSPYGLNHMAGNAAEWVQDWFGIDYYVTMPEHNPQGPSTGRYKVTRGGSWKSAPALLRSATRSGAAPDQRAATIGFRCAKSVP
jgi:formylglycine-generating enzyme required for sulfatase activity